MEPVPETKKMEEFATSPLPNFSRLHPHYQQRAQPQPDLQLQTPMRPAMPRSSTDPSSPSQRSFSWSSPTVPYRPAVRTTSPYSRGHVRSVSTQSALAPPMARTQSFPGIMSTGPLFSAPQRPASPRGSPNCHMRKAVDELFPATTMSRRSNSLSSLNDFSIPEASEVTSGSERSSSPVMGGNTLHPYARIRRPESPLRMSAVHGGSVSPSALTSSPSYQTTRFGDMSTNSYGYGSYASSSVPSTPTSLRSRSPSISSLETIEDIPDAEEAAIEAHRIAQLKADADEADLDEAALELKRKNALDAMGSRGRSLSPFGTRDKRKRWSVCGAERRGDLDLETIWED